MQRHFGTLLTVVGLVIVVAIAAVVGWPWIERQMAARQAPVEQARADDHDHGDAQDHDHDHADEHDHDHDEATTIELSESALRNIGFESIEVKRGPFERSITLPAMVVERPGHSQIHITAPITGKILKIIPIEGAAIDAGSPMFEIGLTHEDLVSAQAELFRTAENLDLINREIERLKNLGEGMIAGQRIIEQQYERQKLEASLSAARQALQLHGLDAAQVDEILKSRKLLSSLTIVAPPHADPCEHCRDNHSFHVQQLMVKPGEQVDAGQLLCVLADHCELLIEGNAFENDAAELRQAAIDGRPISATLLSGSDDVQRVDGLRLLYLADHVDPDTRVLRFYLQLFNEVAYDRVTDEGQHFIAWKFSPGQRMTLHVPVERWDDRIVLPVEAVVDEGPESYVYRRDRGHFDRVEVHVPYRDQRSAVIADDGALRPGDSVAAHGAYQIHLALKNRSGGAVDPHAGHHH